MTAMTFQSSFPYFTRYTEPSSSELLFNAHISPFKLWEYALLTYGNMPVQPRLQVKILLKFKYENIVWLAFQKNLYSKTRLDRHITIREKSVLQWWFSLNIVTRDGTLKQASIFTWQSEMQIYCGFRLSV